MRCGESLQKRCMPRVGRSKIQPGRPRIREVLGRSVAHVATQPDDKFAGGRVEGCYSAALIGRYPKSPTKVGHLNVIEKFIIRQPPIGEKDDHDSENSWISDGLPSISSFKTAIFFKTIHTPSLLSPLCVCSVSTLFSSTLFFDLPEFCAVDMKRQCTTQPLVMTIKCK